MTYMKDVNTEITPTLWCVNIPEEPESSPILHPVPTKKLVNSLFTDLRKKPYKLFQQSVNALLMLLLLRSGKEAKKTMKNIFKTTKTGG